jgi:hypothetical protein
MNISNADILKRAKENCAKEGASWGPEAKVHPGKKFVPLGRTMDDIGKQRHLERAKAELTGERGSPE